MSCVLSSWIGSALLAQAGPAAVPNWLLWFYVWGEQAYTIEGPLGGLLTWFKVVSVFALLGWIGASLIPAFAERQARGARGGWPILDVAAGVAIVVGLIAALLEVMLASKRLSPALSWAPTVLGLVAGAVFLAWVEIQLWSSARRGRESSRSMLIGLHIALALGMLVAFLLFRGGAVMPGSGWRDLFVMGGRLGVTYMGFVVLLRLFSQLLPEFSGLRGRRIYAIAWQSWTEAFRRMWAPWVVIVIFAVILAFTSWFLQPPRPAELGRLYVGTLMLLCSLLLTVLIVILAPISLPNDIRQQTIFTVVTKPVRRLELVWGRIVGYMTLVTVLLLLFGGISLMYYHRMVGAAIIQSRAAASAFTRDNKPELARQAGEQASQLETRMAARLPVYGSLIFFDSRGKERRKGIDVGIELPSRSFIEGATPSRAVWRFGNRIPNPQNPQVLLDRSIPVDDLLTQGTIEYAQNEIAKLADRLAGIEAQRSAADVKSADVKRLTEQATQAQAEIKRLQNQLASLRQQEKTFRDQGKAREIQALHSRAIPVEMTFNVYRTTKGEVGEPVNAQVTVTSPRPDIPPYNATLQVREYYTNKIQVPARMLVGSLGALNVEVKCMSVNQYLGMAEGDLFLLFSKGNFSWNFMRGLFGIWLQALVLTSIGVCAGTFLSWPVALLTTIFFFVAGNVGFTALQQFALSADLVGGGPFESLIRMLSHDNLVSDLQPTLAVVTAKTLDRVVMPVMARLVYLVPNFSALDVSNVVAEGFALTGSRLFGLFLLSLGYAFPFSIVGYLILRNREVAA